MSLRHPSFTAASRGLLALAVTAGACAALVAGPSGAAAAPSPGGGSLALPFEKYQLPNGLDVILHEDHSIPMVAVNVWYHVGSRNEEPGRTGFAHLFEHMMFQGSENHDKDYFAPLERVGGRVNGSTSTDRTNYWENVPANYLELALWLEADRMGFLLPAMTQEKLDNQRDVVKNERRQGLDNQPYAKAEEAMLPLLYPRDHPYSWPVIGSMADLSAASLDDVKEFFRRYYTPNNASLCIAGDFDPAEARALVEKYFAGIPPGAPVDRTESWIPRLDGVRRSRLEDNVNLPRVISVWHTPAYYAPGDAEFDLLASVLAGGKTSRLYKALVYDRQIAQDVSSYQESHSLGGLFRVEVTAKEGHSLAEVEAAMDGELRRALEKGVTRAELDQAKTVYESNFVRRLERIGGFGGKADLLNGYNTMLGDPGRIQWDLDRYRNATPAGVLAFARQYLDMDRRVVLHVVPQGSPAASEVAVDRAREPAPGREPEFAAPAIQSAVLDNGLELYVVEKPNVPIVQASLVLKSGWSSDTAGRFGTAALTAELLDEGTASRSALRISEEAKGLGATLSTQSMFDGSVVSLNVLKRNLAPGVRLIADVAMNPTFPAEELERQRAIYQGRIAQEEKEPFTSALKTFQREVFGARHPYSQPFTGTGTEEAVKTITRDDLVQFYRSHYVPNNAAFIVAGDVTLKEAEALATAAFKDWKRGTVPASRVPAPPAQERTRVVIVDKPGAVQSVIVAGHVGLARKNPEFLAFDVMNNALGGKFTSRINMNLREDKGYTYGANSYVMAFRNPGIFAVLAPVQIQNTRESLTEIVNELRMVTADKPLTDAELADSKSSMMKRFPQDFQSVGTIAGEIGELVLFDLPRDEWQSYLSRVGAIDGPAATRAARSYLKPDALLIVVVGDKEKIEEGIRSLALGDVVFSSAQ